MDVDNYLDGPGRILAFDTSLEVCTAAISIDGVVVAEAHEPMRRGQAERLMPLLVGLCRQASVGFEDMDLLATTRGPGSFTGVRVGLAALRGLALVTGKPVVALTSLEAIVLSGAFNPDDRSTLVSVDARREQVYVEEFVVDVNGYRSLKGPMLLDLADLAKTLPERSRRVIGNGRELVAAALAGAEPDDTAPEMPIAARFIGYVGQRSAQAGSTVAPTYLRDPDAKLPNQR